LQFDTIVLGGTVVTPTGTSKNPDVIAVRNSYHGASPSSNTITSHSTWNIRSTLRLVCITPFVPMPIAVALQERGKRLRRSIVGYRSISRDRMARFAMPLSRASSITTKRPTLIRELLSAHFDTSPTYGLEGWIGLVAHR